MRNTPNEDLPPVMKALDRLAGTWKISGDAGGTATYVWMDGGYFLLQHSAMEFQGGVHTALDIIGMKGIGTGEPEQSIISRSYSSTGVELDYTYELKDDTLTIWRGPKGSTTFSKSTFSEDGHTLTGAWEWPGGGYSFVMTRESDKTE